MLTIKSLLVKAEKPQDQTCASKVQAIIDHMLADPTTGLSKAIEDSVIDSLVYGSSMFTVNSAASIINAMDYTTRFEEIPTVQIGHFSRAMTNDQLKAAWLLVYGNSPITFLALRRKWKMDEIGDDMRVAQETHARGLLLSESDINSYTQVYVLKDKLEKT